jgi:pimeloyl-ACP methyl ester carboxylesterase
MRRLLVLLLLLTTSAFGTTESKPIIVIVHGAWGGAWQFSRIEPFLRDEGFGVHRVTLTGLGERSHLVDAAIGLETHIEDVLNLIRFERLDEVILLGHSYGGMVITGVADRMPERIARLVYLDAILPESGESAFNVMGADKAQALAARAEHGLIPAWWVRPDKPFPRDTTHPLLTLQDKLILTGAGRDIPGLYVLTTEDATHPERDDFYPLSLRAKERGYAVITVAGDHNVHWRQPEATAQALAAALREP